MGKFKGENSKATAARAAKAAKTTAEQDRIQKEKDDAAWEDNHKTGAKKAARKDDKEAKRLADLARKRELKELADAEMIAAGAKPVVEAAPKVTRAQLDAKKEREMEERRANAEKEKLAKKKIVVVEDEELLVDNVNRLTVEGRGDDSVATVADNVDRHAEKRMRATYNQFEEKRMPQLKMENPTSRLSQLRQMLKKEWQKSPDNPINARIAAVNLVKTNIQEQADEDESD